MSHDQQITPEFLKKERKDFENKIVEEKGLTILQFIQQENLKGETSILLTTETPYTLKGKNFKIDNWDELTIICKWLKSQKFNVSEINIRYDQYHDGTGFNISW